MPESNLNPIHEIRAIYAAMEQVCKASKMVAFACDPNPPYSAFWFTSNMFECLGAQKSDFTSGRWRQLVHPDDYLEVVENDGAVGSGITRYRMKNPNTGQYYWLEGSNEFLRDSSGQKFALVGWIKNQGDADDQRN